MRHVGKQRAALDDFRADSYVALATIGRAHAVASPGVWADARTAFGELADELRERSLLRAELHVSCGEQNH